MITFNLLAWVSLAIVLCNLYLLGTSRLPAMIKAVAVQGLLMSALPILLPHPAEWLHVVLLVVLSAAIKGFLIQFALFRAIRDVRIVREVNASVGFTFSVVFGITAAAVSFFVLRKIPFYSVSISPFHASTAIATATIGLFLLVTRRNVVSQVIGYLVFENAGFILGVSVAAYQPLFIEMGVLLDILVGVFIMVVAIRYVRSAHDSISVQSLERLTR
jgi:hydrogenase-4 component E